MPLMCAKTIARPRRPSGDQGSKEKACSKPFTSQLCLNLTRCFFRKLNELEPRSFAFYIKEDVHELRLNQIPCESKIISGVRFLVMKDIYMHVSYEKAVGKYVCV